jgi:hypothetical protein
MTTSLATLISADELRAIIREELAGVTAATVETLDCAGAGKLAARSASHMRTLARKGVVLAHLVDGRWRFRRGDVLAWINR